MKRKEKRRKPRLPDIRTSEKLCLLTISTFLKRIGSNCLNSISKETI